MLESTLSQDVSIINFNLSKVYVRLFVNKTVQTAYICKRKKAEDRPENMTSPIVI